MDQGGKLWRSTALRNIVAKAGYGMEPTGIDSPHQNGKVERLSGTFGVPHGSLSFILCRSSTQKYWSSALVHAVHLNNRLWHSALTCTPYKAWNHTPPNMSHLRVFGSLVTPRRPGPRPA
jgi:hypothetical protein